jgi:hypothetical protein
MTMKKWIFSLALVFSATLPNTAIQKMVDHDHDIAPQKLTAHDEGHVSPDEVETGHLIVKPMQITGFSGVSLVKLKLAFSALETVVNSEEFKDRVINFKNTKGERQFASNKGQSNEQVYQIFMEGRETLQMNTPGEMNFFLSLYNKPYSRVIGYTSGEINTININWKFFKNYAPSDVAANLAHEWTHKIGFDHTSAAEHDSAPYAIGYIVGDMASRLLKNHGPH